MSFSEALEKLKEAESLFESASIAERVASSEATAALNRLNDAQKAFDEECEKVRGKAKGGDWKSQRRFNGL